MSRASSNATRLKSTIPVSGACRPWTPRTWGSISRSRARSTFRSPATPFSRAAPVQLFEPRHLALRGRDDDLAAALDTGSPCDRSTRRAAAFPSTHSRALSDPGA